MTIYETDDLIYQDLWNSLLDEFDIGRFKLDTDDNIVNVDEDWLRLYGFKRSEEVIGKNISEFYVDKAEASLVTQMVKLSPKQVQTHVCLLRKKDGEHFFCKIHTRGMWDENGVYLGRIGFVRDATAEEVQMRLEENFPVAFYIVRKIESKDVIVYCNQAFLQLYDFASKKDALGFPIEKLYQSPSDYELFIQICRDASSDPLLTRRTRVKSRKNRLFTIESSIFCASNERYGILVDASEKERLFQTLANLNLILHNYHTSMQGFVLTLEALIRTIRGDPFTEIDDVMEENLREYLEDATNDLVARADALWELAQIRGVEADLLDFRHLIDILADRVYQMKWEALLAPKLEAALRIQRQVDNLMSLHRLPRVQLRHLRESAQQVNRAISLIFLHRSRRKMIEIGEEVQQLLAQTTYKSDSLEKKKTTVNFWRITRDAMNQQSKFAQTRGIHLRHFCGISKPMVWGSESDLTRAVGGLLHNAIKYSWTRRNGSEVRITLRRGSAKERFYELEISNYGLIIAQDEIVEGLVFEFGYRGRFSGDRGRPGSGIGLYDAKRVVEDHGGEITITSVPVRPVAPEENLRYVPHITTVTVRLPEYMLSQESIS